MSPCPAGRAVGQPPPRDHWSGGAGPCFPPRLPSPPRCPAVPAAVLCCGQPLALLRRAGPPAVRGWGWCSALPGRAQAGSLCDKRDGAQPVPVTRWGWRGRGLGATAGAPQRGREAQPQSRRVRGAALAAAEAPSGSTMPGTRQLSVGPGLLVGTRAGASSSTDARLSCRRTRLRPRTGLCARAGARGQAGLLTGMARLCGAGLQC